MANQHGPVPTAGAASCVVDYSPHAVAERAFAFDGTVTAIGPDTTNRPGRGHLDLASVTFAVNEWFRGGSTETATVDMTSPTIEISGESRQTYGIGTRLLVAGEPRGGDVDPMADAIAWDTCNFTRYWDEETADVWRAASVQWKDALTRAACWARVTGIPDYIAGGPTAPANESSPIELAARTVEALRLADDFPDVSVVVGTDYDVSQVIWIVSDDHIIGELNYAHGDSGWYITEMNYC
jgi:hypothetical protein